MPHYVATPPHFREVPDNPLCTIKKRAGEISEEICTYLPVPNVFVSIESTDYWMGMEKNRVGNLLAAARLKAGLTQSKLAQEPGIRQNMVSDYENGRRTYSDAMAKRLSAVLKVKEDHLKYGSEPEH